MSDPFGTFGRLLLAVLKITGYCLTSVVQVVWYLAHRRTDRVGDVIGYFGRASTDAIAGIFK